MQDAPHCSQFSKTSDNNNQMKLFFFFFQKKDGIKIIFQPSRWLVPNGEHSHALFTGDHKQVHANYAWGSGVTEPFWTNLKLNGGRMWRRSQICPVGFTFSLQHGAGLHGAMWNTKIKATVTLMRTSWSQKHGIAKKVVMVEFFPPSYFMRVLWFTRFRDFTIGILVG